jgi:hypothetical protein
MRGCKFFQAPGGGYCRPTNTGLIEENCVLSQDRCFTPAEYTRRTGQAPPPRAVAVAPSPALPPAASTVAARAIRRGVQFISGPVSWYFFDFLGRKFHFFGDAHFSKDNNCPRLFDQPCTTVTPQGEIVTPNQLCYDITYLLRELFDRSQREATYTDFFMEFPLRRGSSHSDLDQISNELQSGQPLTQRQREQVENLDYIGTLYLLFNQCFQISKETCPYRPYVRFHYVDVRLAESGQDFVSLTLNSYLFIESIHTVLILMKLYYALAQYSLDLPEAQKLRQQIQSQVEFTNSLIDRVLLRGRTLQGETVDYNSELFNATFRSNDYPAEVDRIFGELLAGLPTGSKAYDSLINLRERMKQPVVRRDNRLIHRIQAQLESLRADNVIYQGHNMADLITEFIQNRYRRSNLTTAYNRWRQFYNQVYLPFSHIVTTIDLERSLVGFQQFNRNEKNTQLGLLISTDALLMDAYLLARMFRRFITPRHGRGPHMESNQVVTYTGAEHTLTYVAFFQEVLQVNPIDKVPAKPESTTIRCLNNPRFSQDFGDL